jgi:integrase
MSRSLYSAVVLALNTGLRLGELTSLRWAQVDFIRRRLMVGKSKTAAGEGRGIPLNEAAFNALTLQANRFPDREDEHYVFPTEQYHVLEKRQGSAAWGLDPLKPITDMGEAWDAAKARTADAKKRLPAAVCRWHDLRHTFVSRLVEGGTPYPKLAGILGWNPATAVRMAKRYGHVSVEALREDEDRLDRRENEGEGAKKEAKWTPEPSSSVSSPHEFKWLWGVESNHQPSG